MPKAQKSKFYAVRKGREGPKIYDNWEECKANVSRYPSAAHKSFPSLQQATDWLASQISEFSASQPSAIPNIPLNLTNTANNHLPQVDLPTFDNEGNEEDFIPLDPDWSPPVQLSSEQRVIFDKVKEGGNVFFTGSAGTGKSVLLREIIRLRGGCASSRLGITASTGIAAVNIGGTTLHSWAGIGLGQESVEKLIGKIFGQKKLRDILHRWQNVQTLIIDEVSMIDGDLFDKLVSGSSEMQQLISATLTDVTQEALGRALRNSDAPFGGIQLVLCGDFCQLPPVGGRDIKGQPIIPIFAFDAESWNRCVGPPMNLTRVFRQKDQAFADMLNAMRFGRVDPWIEETFMRLSRKVVYTDGIDPTELFSTRAEVDNANQSRLRALPGEPHRYNADDTAGVNSNGKRVTQDQMARLLERLIAPKSIELKVGAQVMLIKNLIQGQLVNGSVGKITQFVSSAEALKMHVEIAKTEGQRSKQQLHTDPSRDVVWPVVRFTNGKEIMIIPQEFTVNNADGKMEARREQVPLILAYALSVHKAQGQTLERVKVDLKRTFEKGQAYVALSRATSMETLEVLNFSAAKVTAHPRVLAWYGQSSARHEELEDEMENEAMIAYYAA